jgi:hypothetical protein
MMPFLNSPKNRSILNTFEKRTLVDDYLLEEVNERIVGHFPGNISFLPGGKRLKINITS